VFDFNEWFAVEAPDFSRGRRFSVV